MLTALVILIAVDAVTAIACVIAAVRGDRRAEREGLREAALRAKAEEARR